MTGLLFDGEVSLRDVPFDIFSVQAIISTKAVEIVELPDAIMYISESGKDAGKARNDLASLIARREIYGPALIAGFGGDDVPQQYVEAYMV
jgi:hypothetical protein